MKQRGVSAFSRAYWYMRMRRLGNNLSIHSDVCSRTELKMLTVLTYFLYSWLLQIGFSTHNGRSESFSCFYYTSCKQLIADWNPSCLLSQRYFKCNTNSAE
jgi:hypothetical protein